MIIISFLKAIWNLFIIDFYLPQSLPRTRFGGILQS